MLHDVVIVGGGPAGLSAALAVGRARRRVLLCDAGPRRNAAATHIHNFVTRDGTPPGDFRAIGREQLVPYGLVSTREVNVVSVTGTRGAFQVTLPGEAVQARRVLICTGMVDQLLPMEGFREAWGTSIFQCPYCHGWENRDRAWGYLARAADAAHVLPFAVMARAWTRNVTVFTHAEVELPEDTRSVFQRAGIHAAPQRIARLVQQQGVLSSVELADGTRVPCDALFAHPPQAQVALVQALGLALDEHGFVQVDPMRKETSVPGIYAAGDLTTRMQAAISAAAAGTQAAAAINGDVMMERATQGALE